MGRPGDHPDQADLLAWVPPAPVVRFEPVRVRAATLTGKVKRAIAETLRTAAELGRDRAAIAEAMATFLGEDVPKSALDTWASEAREEHLPNVVRFIALLHATGDQRLLQVIADAVGCAAVDRKFLPLIELASLREHEDAVARRRRELQAISRHTGALK